MLDRLLHIAILLAALTLPLVPCEGKEDLEDVKEALEKSGFTNIRAVASDSLTLFTIQNEAWSLPASGAAEAVRILENEGVLDGGSQVKVVLLDRSVPQATLSYNAALGNWKVSHRVSRSEMKTLREGDLVRNPSFGKVDIVVYPQVSLMNLIITQVYQSLWQLNPAFEMELWPGAKASFQVKIPVFNDGYGELEDKIHPGMMTLSQRFRLPGDIVGKATAGFFMNSRYGLSLDLRRRFNFAPWIMIEGGASFLGLTYFDGFNCHIDTRLYPYWYVGGDMYWPQAEAQFRMRIQKFLLDDVGVKCEMIKHYRYCSIGFYLERGFNGYAHTNGGFRFQIALPPYRFKRYGYFPRVTTSGQMGMTYNANNEQVWYKETKYEASENIMSDNAYNPYYLEKEIKQINSNFKLK